MFCRDKHVFGATEYAFVTTSILLSRQKRCYLWQLPPMTVVGLHNNYTYGDSWWKQYNVLAWHAHKHETCPPRVREREKKRETETDRDRDRQRQRERERVPSRFRRFWFYLCWRNQSRRYKKEEKRKRKKERKKKHNA